MLITKLFDNNFAEKISNDFEQAIKTKITHINVSFEL